MSEQESEIGQNLRTLLEQHALHSRHLENERTGLLFAYIASTASITGGIYSLGATYLGTNARLLLIVPILLTLIVFSLTKRWSQAFEMHEQKMDNIIMRLGYLDYTMDVTANWFFKFFRTRRLFYAYYVVMFGILVFLMFCLPPPVACKLP